MNKTTRCGTVAIVGRPNVGKSTLLNALLGQKLAPTTHKPQTTRRTLRGVVQHGDAQIVLVDTPGLHKPVKGLHAFMVREALDAAKDVDVLAFVTEASTLGIHKDDEIVLRQLEKEGATAHPIVLVLNKIDKLKDKSALLPLLKTWAAGERFKALVPVAAAKKKGLTPLLDEIARHLPEAAPMFPADTLTDASERDICADLIREKVMLELRQEIPYRAAVVVEEFDESRREEKNKPLVRIAAVIHVERDSQKAVVVGKKGERVKAIGQRARAELETLLACQVMLQLFVRVEPDWTTSDAGLKKLGYVRSR
ncbi:MAG: GTPase Era [Deltaproteobacteria bacterium]|nr:GTPase Era [Deltaproteobacteria bacterium]